MRKLRVPRHVADLVRHAHPQLKRKIKASLEAILADPDSGTPLKAELAGLRSFRVGRFQIVYKVLLAGKETQISAIGPRIRIYEETLRRIKRKEKS
jgi:mRNA interferase RelE/StbE